jgi:ribosomal protein L40E
MWALRRDVSQRPKSVREWIEALEKVAGEIDEQANQGKTRLVILAPQGSEVYVDDERKGMVGSSGRLIINNLPIGQHILRISKAGEKDDERLIEIRGDTAEQVIQAQFKSSGLTSAASGSGAKSSILPGIVACKNCGARFAEGVKFCGKCGKSEFTVVSVAQQTSGQINCPRCASLLPSNAKFCGRCGAPIISKTQSPSVDAGSKGVVSRPNSEIKKLCVSCGMINPLSAKFCGRCGAIV